MGQAREIMDRITDAAIAGDMDALGRLYAADAVVETPDEGRIEGRPAIVEYFMTLQKAFPDGRWESGLKYEDGDTAIDAGYVVGTHTGPLVSPTGEIPPTGRTVRVRECDILTVRDGVGVEHRMYFDQMEFLTQLGLAGSGAAATGLPGPRQSADQPSTSPAR